jgi:hypothetical protein
LPKSKIYPLSQYKLSGKPPLTLQAIGFPTPEAVHAGECPAPAPQSLEGAYAQDVWQDGGTSALHRCQPVSFIIENQADSRQDYYMTLLEVDRSGTSRVLFPWYDPDPNAQQDSLVESGAENALHLFRHHRAIWPFDEPGDTALFLIASPERFNQALLEQFRPPAGISSTGLRIELARWLEEQREHADDLLDYAAWFIQQYVVRVEEK